MRKGVVIFPVFLSVGAFFVSHAALFSQEISKRQLPLSQQKQASIAAVTPGTIHLQPGGPAAIVTVEGKCLETILSVQAIRNGQRVGEISVKQVKPWPASRKLELQAGATAPVRPGCQLRVIGQAGPNAFQIDVPLAVFSLDVAGNKLQNLQQGTLPDQGLSPLPQSGFPLTPLDLRNIKAIYKALRELAQLKYSKTYTRNFEKELRVLEQFLAKERMVLSPEERRALLVFLEDLRKRLEKEMEAIRDRRSEFQTMFENFDQKANQLFNILSTVLKSIKEMSQSPRNLL